MAKTKFGVFSLSQFPDLAKVVESFDNDLGFFELAEQLGYDKVWIAEHLFSTYGLVTSTQVYAAAIAQRTKKIRIGMAVCAIPFNHPLRTASDFALVDILSHGRLDFGVGRAYQPHEFVGLGVPMDQSREMLAEGLDIVGYYHSHPDHPARPSETDRRIAAEGLSDGLCYVVVGVQGGTETLATAWMFRDADQAFAEEPFEII